MAKKVFALLTDVNTAKDEEGFIRELSEFVAARDIELKVLPSVEKLSEMEASKALKDLAVAVKKASIDRQSALSGDTEGLMRTIRAKKELQELQKAVFTVS